MTPSSVEWLGIDRVPFIGGCLCLDFVNTTGNRGLTDERERLTSYADWLVFLKRSEIAAPLPLHKIEAQRDFLSNVIEFRECLFRLFKAMLNNAQPVAADLRFFSRYAKRARARQELRWRDGKLEWRGPNDLETPMDLIVLSASELFNSTRIESLKQCGECDWLFIDTSKNQGRKWCKKRCGDRVKARRYYRNSTDRN